MLRGVAGWPHWTAVLKENANGQKWAVDSWIYANGRTGHRRGGKVVHFKPQPAAEVDALGWCQRLDRPDRTPILGLTPGGMGAPAQESMSWYRTKVERDLSHWQASGWVSETGAAAIRGELARHASRPSASAGVLAVLGAVLFGFAAMSFVAANWNDMSRLARLVLLVGALWAFYGGAAYLFAIVNSQRLPTPPCLAASPSTAPASC